MLRPRPHFVLRGVFSAVACLCASAAPAVAQLATDSVLELVPGPRYDALAGQSWLFGSGHRDLWVDTIAVPRLDLAATAGGLELVCSPATLLSVDIRFRGADGSSWIFTSMDKPFGARYLPRSLYQGVAGQIIQDAVAAFHPAAQSVVPPLYQSVGVPYPDAQLVALPNTESIVDFDEEAQGKPGWWTPEVVPGSTWINGLEDTDSIITTQELWERTRGDGDVVDVRAYLTARLVDVLVGETAVDFNRIRWARVPGTTPTRWRPVPWDRGNAFANFDGFSRWYARFYFPALVKFEEDYPSIEGLVTQGLELDRRFLAGAELALWDSVTAGIQRAVTDSLIDAAVGRLPAEFHREGGDELARILKIRRDRLSEAAEDYYRLLAKWVDVHVTERRALVEARRLSDRRLTLTIRPHPENGTADTVASFSRTFRAEETKEIRLYLDGARDSVVITGEDQLDITLRIVSDDQGDVVVPTDVPQTEVHRIDPDEANPLTTIIRPRFGGQVNLHRRPRAIARECLPPSPEAASDLRTPQRDWGSTWMPVPALGYVSGLGVYAGAGAARTDFAFGKVPFKAQHVLWGGWASSPNSFFAEYYSDFRQVAGPLGGYLGAMASGVGNPEFHGLGNETVDTMPDSFYQIDQFQGMVTPLITLNPQAYTQVAAGVYFRASNTTTGQGNIIDAQQPFGSGRVNDAGLMAWLKYDSYNDQIDRPGGVQLNVGTQLGVADGDSTFVGLAADILGFRSSDALPGHPTLVLRAGGQVNWGSYPFYSAAFLGGTDNLKGFAPNRYGGDASLYLNSELRLFVTEIHWPLIANFGVLGIADVGRVFLRGESSRTWHTGFGGGIWFGLLRSGQGLNLALVDGESLRLYISTGFILKKKRLR